MPEQKAPQPNLQPSQKPIENSTAQLQNLKTIWKKEIKEDGPKINLEIVFGGHISTRDLEEIKKEFESCDIYAPEWVGWGKNSDFIFSKLSEGIMSPQQADDMLAVMDPNHKKDLQYPFNAATRKMIYRSRKPIIFVDLPYDNKYSQSHKSSARNFSIAFGAAKSGGERLVILKKHLIEEAQVNISRERFMLEQIPKKIREVLDRRQDLARKPEIKVLISLGMDHVAMYDQMLGINEKVSVHTSAELETFGFMMEGIRRVERGENPDSFSDEFWGRIMVEMHFWGAFEKSIKVKSETVGTASIYKAVQKIIGSLSMEDMAKINSLVTQGKKYRDAVLTVCREKGIEMKGF